MAIPVNPGVTDWVNKWFGGFDYDAYNATFCNSGANNLYATAQSTGLYTATNPAFAAWFSNCANGANTVGYKIPSYIGPQTNGIPVTAGGWWGTMAGAAVGLSLAAVKSGLDARWTLLGAVVGAGGGWLFQYKLLPFAEKSGILWAAIGGAAFGGLDLLFSAGQNRDSAIVFALLGAGWSWVVAQEIMPWANQKFTAAEQDFDNTNVHWWGFFIPGYNLYEWYKLLAGGGISGSGDAIEAVSGYTGITVGYLLLTAGVLLNVSAVREKVVSLAGGNGGSNLTSLLPLLLA